MFSMLAKWIIKEKPTDSLPQVRYAYGVLGAGLGIALNILLCVGKLAVGIIASSVAITADALNNLSDAGTSFVSLMGFIMAKQKPDEKHPFGHGRVEYLAGLIVASAILVMGYELLKSSLERVRQPVLIQGNTLTFLVLGISILIKLYMSLYNRKIGRAIQSPAMRATATDSFFDAISTLAVLISTIAGKYYKLNLDAWCGLLVAILVFVAGWRTIQDAVSSLLGQSPDEHFVTRIKEIVDKYSEILGHHDLMVHDYGPGRRMISLHAEVAAEGDMLKLHDTIDNLEKELQDTLGCQAVIHMDPIVTDDERVNDLKAQVAKLVQKMDRRVMIHDFRMVTGPTHTNLIFDVEVPFDVKMADEAIKSHIGSMIKEMDAEFFAVVDVDRMSPRKAKSAN
ncbi:MAG: cation diffusion facilitator family transporter [Clostridium sp.]|jgi:cation diffusion facilitator family transporter|nr:cation diffusion facilitator family transporter [Clostridium sp.]